MKISSFLSIRTTSSIAASCTGDRSLELSEDIAERSSGCDRSHTDKPG